MAVCAAFLASASAGAADWTLVATPARASDGVFQLVWAGGDGTMALEESRSDTFDEARVLYRGEDRARVVSGRRDGTYHYRLRPLRGDALGMPVASATVVVRHHSLARALAFFAAGLFVFLATVRLVLRGTGDDAPPAGEGAA